MTKPETYGIVAVQYEVRFNTDEEVMKEAIEFANTQAALGQGHARIATTWDEFLDPDEEGEILWDDYGLWLMDVVDHGDLTPPVLDEFTTKFGHVRGPDTEFYD